MVRINQIKLDITATDSDLKRKILSVLRITENSLKNYKIVKRSIDARKGDVKYVYQVDVEIDNEKKVVHRLRNNNIKIVDKVKYRYNVTGKEKLSSRPIIVGTGPAGLFCGYMLAKAGYKPLLIERGQKVEERMESVNTFWTTGKLNVESNVQFGEGGAGTFSDGKLNTLVKDAYGRGKEVLETFVKFGAPEEIVYDNKPHIGTDKLVDVVRKMRNAIIELGGEVLFNTKLTDIHIDNGRVTKIEVNNFKWIDTDVVVLAIGHSARDTFRMIKDKNLNISKKAFAIGVRVEHSQDMINKVMYGDKYKLLGAAPYKLTYKTEKGRAVYSFCMCPGGFVVNASSVDGHLVVNGMSNYDRAEKNANSAIIVNVTPEDFDEDDVLAGVKFQEKWERKAYEACNGNVPVQLFGDFKEGKESKEFGTITPNIKGQYEFYDINKILPLYVSESLVEGIEAFDKKIKGFANKDTVLSGIETRTSSPIRIERNEDFCSNIDGIYPCGEGAGYAGGITSAAIDGLKVFEAIISRYYSRDCSRDD